jgi:hypothetical protein
MKTVRHAVAITLKLELTLITSGASDRPAENFCVYNISTRKKDPGDDEQ